MAGDPVLAVQWRLNMHEHDLRRSVEQARQQLNALRVRVAASGLDLASPKIAFGLGSVEETLERLQANCALLRDILEKADGVLAEYQDGHHAAGGYLERLRSMTLENLVMEEDERRLLANQLQSGLGQDLALTRMSLAALRDSTSAELQASLLGIERLVEQADRSFRSVAFRISPLILYDVGLVPALEWLAEDVRERCGIELSIADEGQVEPLGETLRVIVFRVLRELVMLAGRAGKAGQPVMLRYHGDEAQLRITIGCDWSWLEEGAEGPAGNGLFNLREQLGHVQATLEVDAVAGRGTTATVIAPLAGSSR